MSNNLNGRDRLLQRLVSGALPFLMLGCSTVPMGPGTALAAQSDGAESLAQAQPEPEAVSTAPVSQSTMDGQLMFELMIAELAGRRGQLDVAMAGYLRASKHTDDPRVSERATRLAMYGQQWAEAQTAAQRWLELDPDAAEVREMLGQTFLQQNKTADAIEIYQQLITETDNPEQTIYQVQSELQAANNPVQAIEVMQALISAVPDNSQAHLALANLLMATNDEKGALASLEQALSLDAGNSNALLLKARLLMASGQSEEAFASLETVLEKNPDKLLLRLGYAQLLLDAGRADETGEQLDVVFQGADNNPDTLLTISLLALDARQVDRAETYLKRLRETGRYTEQANFYEARINDQRKDYDAAIQLYDAVGEGELQLPAQIRVAELMGISGDLDGGRDRLHQLMVAVSDPQIQTQLLTAESRMLQEAGQGEQAVSVLTEALLRFPGNGDLLYARALAADSAGDTDRLVDDLNELIKSEPDNAHALNALGYHLADNNVELGRAEELLVKANKLLPNDPAILDSLGWLRYRQGNYTEAVSMLKSAYSLYQDPEIAAHLGEALWHDGSEEEARTVIDDALIESPKDDRLLKIKQKYTE
ncbi:tetratricopeptide repeat protein [Granulosicoccus antarcticus]|uniref:Beta-barrel assembly-enhancing protease n=1 Tax=Granulosicoccus antarcticus IMCC3135 TaxID=1192854 RepID=A0A2Z2NTZ1_9GAMM|nr:tetratricopeptide repeat protein [Granulosicoccus antarcticus]ASJ72230.1 Beta-barrel assembly-enhancing protease [Granulosicoccus antarcticus IMCC3135]